MPPHSLHRTPPPTDVGATIRRLRERAGLSTRELARRTGVAASYVSKVELGALGAKTEFCHRVARVLDLPRAERALLAALLALESAEHHPVPHGSGALMKAQRAVRKYERSCHSFRVFQLSVIPGLLQTREYAQSVLGRFGSRSTSGQAVRERLARQRILADRKRRFWFLIADWALAPHWCSRRVMAAQREHLAKISRQPNVAIHVVPHDFEFPKDVPPLVSGFEVLDEALVIVDTLSGFTTFRRTEAVARYVAAFDTVFQMTMVDQTSIPKYYPAS